MNWRNCEAKNFITFRIIAWAIHTGKQKSLLIIVNLYSLEFFFFVWFYCYQSWYFSFRLIFEFWLEKEHFIYLFSWIWMKWNSFEERVNEKLNNNYVWWCARSNHSSRALFCFWFQALLAMRLRTTNSFFAPRNENAFYSATKWNKQTMGICRHGLIEKE